MTLADLIQLSQLMQTMQHDAFYWLLFALIPLALMAFSGSHLVQAWRNLRAVETDRRRLKTEQTRDMAMSAATMVMAVAMLVEVFRRYARH